MISGNLPILLVFLGAGVAIGFLIARRVYLSGGRRWSWSGKALAAATICFIALLPALAISDQNLTVQDDIHRLKQEAIEELGGQSSAANYAFSLNFGWDDVVWISVDPEATTKELKDTSEIPSSAVLLETIKIYKYESNSHCYPVNVGAKVIDICPQH